MLYLVIFIYKWCVFAWCWGGGVGRVRCGEVVARGVRVGGGGGKCGVVSVSFLTLFLFCLSLSFLSKCAVTRRRRVD